VTRSAKTLLALTMLLCLGVAGGGWLTRPLPLSPDLPESMRSSGRIAGLAKTDPDNYLRMQESKVRTAFGITPGAEKRIVWSAAPGARSDYVVIYLHGFSATRQEIAPVPEQVAKALGANLFETRLAGHGREREPLSDVRAEEWLEDGVEALTIGKALGDKLILIGTSTGATIALAMARSADFADVDSLILISPNFGPAAAGADMAVGPYGPQLTRLFGGEYRQWQAANDLQEKYWDTRYPTAAVVEMMRLVALANTLTPEAEVPRALLVYSPQDDVVSVEKLLAGFAGLPAAHKAIQAIENPDSLSPHVLTGDILAPNTSAATARMILEFLAPDPDSAQG
jgi:alpha-beta hydrolase superfamily lysophospholipase